MSDYAKDAVMDPTQTLVDILDAFSQGWSEEAIDDLRNLADWLERGGFPPLAEVEVDTIGRKYVVMFDASSVEADPMSAQRRGL